MTPGDRLHSVEALRGIAALGVMCFHFSAGALPESWLKTFGTYGHLGVPVFFVISGFIIPYSMSQNPFSLRRDGWTFFLKRVCRLEPAYLTTVALCAVLFVVSGAVLGTPVFGDLLYNAMLHPLYLVPWFGGNWFSIVFWTLAIEFQYYILVLFLSPFLLSFDRRVIYACLAVVFALPFLVTDGRLVFSYLPLFGFGFIGFLYRRNVVSLVEALLLLVAFAFPLYLGFTLLFVVASVATVAIIAAAQFGRSPILEILGTLSYSIYLLHIPIGGRVISMGRRLGVGVTVEYLFFLSAIGVTLCAAYVLWRFVERPSLAMSKRISVAHAARIEALQLKRRNELGASV